MWVPLTLIYPIKKHTLSQLCWIFNWKIESEKKKTKTRLENNAKHEMGWVEKMNTRFEKQKMSLENEKRKWIHPQ